MNKKIFAIGFLVFLVSAVPVFAEKDAATDGGRLRIGSASASVKLNARITGSLSNKGPNTLTVNGITINISSNAKLLRRFFGNSGLDEMQTGDTLSIIGQWTDANKTAINAKIIRDLSIQKVRAVLIGTINSVSGNVIILDTKSRGQQTVTVDSNTKYVNIKEQPITLADLKVGGRIRVKGIWDRNTKTMVEVTQIKDYGLPTP